MATAAVDGVARVKSKEPGPSTKKKSSSEPTDAEGGAVSTLAARVQKLSLAPGPAGDPPSSSNASSETSKKKKRRKKRYSGATPYQGKMKSFGFFQCTCGRSWASAHSWANTAQRCFRCRRYVYPHAQQRLRRRKGRKRRAAPHQVGDCEMCERLGRSCQDTARVDFQIVAGHLTADQEDFQLNIFDDADD